MKITVIVLCAALAVLTAVPALGHQPSEITIVISGEDIDVTVHHSVGDPAAHYIKSIRVSLNGVPAAQEDFVRQAGNTQKARFSVPGLKKGDVVTVQADCSRFGSLSRTQTAGS